MEKVCEEWYAAAGEQQITILIYVLAESVTAFVREWKKAANAGHLRYISLWRDIFCQEQWNRSGQTRTKRGL